MKTRSFTSRRMPLDPQSSRASAILYLFLSLLIPALVLLAGCGSEAPGTSAATQASQATETSGATEISQGTETSAAQTAGFPVSLTDDTGRSVTIDKPPARIVSTAPANTEILFALGLGSKIVGVSSLDDYPAEARDIEKVGDFRANTEKILSLDPDLVVGYSGNEEALKPVAEAGAAVLILDPKTVDGVYKDIELVGKATGAETAAAELVESIRTGMEGVSNSARETGDKPKVFFAVDNTLWTVGPGSFVDELLRLANADNAATEAGGSDPYFQMTPEQLVAQDPDVILLPQSVFKSVEEFTSDPLFGRLRAVESGRVVLIDDIIVTRPGPRVVDGLSILVEAIHPGSS